MDLVLRLGDLLLQPCYPLISLRRSTPKRHLRWELLTELRQHGSVIVTPNADGPQAESREI